LLMRQAISRAVLLAFVLVVPLWSEAGGYNLRNDIPVGSKLKALHFLHGCAYAVDKGTKVGEIIIHYEDGKAEQIPLIYEDNTYAWDDQSLGMAYGFAWQGKTPDGRVVGVCDLAWSNKRPEIKIESIDFIAASTQASPFLLAVTAEL